MSKDDKKIHLELNNVRINVKNGEKNNICKIIDV